MLAGRRITLKQLAADLGVNTSTVSRVLNDPAGVDTRWASPATARRIIDYAQATGYRKNPHAASLRTDRSGLVGVVVPRLQDYILATMYEGVEAAAAKRGMFAVVANSLDDPELRKLRTQQLLDRFVEGLILGDARINDELVVSLREREIPTVLMNRTSEGIPSATCDDYDGGYQIGEHFARMQYDTIDIISGKLAFSTSRDRAAGFKAALKHAGFDTDTIRTVVRGYDAQSGARAMEEILASDRRPRAVFAVNDFSAIGALGALRAQRIRVPEEMALAGFNDTPLAAGVSLTTARSPMHEIGFEAFGLLMRVLDGEKPHSLKLKPALVVRDTA